MSNNIISISRVSLTTKKTPRFSSARTTLTSASATSPTPRRAVEAEAATEVQNKLEVRKKDEERRESVALWNFMLS